MVDITSALKTLYEIEKRRHNHYHTGVLRGLIEEYDQGNLEFLNEVFMSLGYDLQHANDSAKYTPKRRLIENG